MDSSLQVTACFALAHLSYGHAQSSDLIASIDGINTILKSMKQFNHHESLQTTALFALGSIVMHSGNKLIFHLEISLFFFFLSLSLSPLLPISYFSKQYQFQTNNFNNNFCRQKSGIVNDEWWNSPNYDCNERKF